MGGLGQAANGRAPLGRADLDGLAALSGRKFLDAFWLKQLDALSQLRADYTSYAERVRYDVRYTACWSFWRDVLIVLKTVPVVVSRRGSC